MMGPDLVLVVGQDHLREGERKKRAKHSMAKHGRGEQASEGK